MVGSIVTVFRLEETMSGKVWTPEQEKQLKKLVEEHASLPAIAKTLGKSLEAVRSKAKRLGLVDDDQKKKKSAVIIIYYC